MRRLCLAVLGVTLTLSLGCFGGPGSVTKRLDGAGSTFVDPMMQEWAGIYKKDKGVAINYQGGGSGKGIRMMTAMEVDFGCSDAPLNQEQIDTCKEKGGEVIHVPLCMGAIVPAYNLKGVDDLVLSGEVLMKIYLGKITTWNDPELVKLNPKVKLPAEKISVCFRSDSSGSSYILTDYFTKIDAKTWTPGRGTAPKFPEGTGAKGTSGVAGFVKQNHGSIGYVELIYALGNEIPFAKVINSKGKAVKADMKSVTAAAATAEIPEDLRYSITNAPGEEAYPISGTVWAIIYTKQPKEKGTMVKDFITWITHDGQQYTEKLHYAPLPEVVVKKVDTLLKKVE